MKHFGKCFYPLPAHPDLHDDIQSGRAGYFGGKILFQQLAIECSANFKSSFIMIKAAPLSLLGSAGQLKKRLIVNRERFNAHLF